MRRVLIALVVLVVSSVATGVGAAEAPLAQAASVEDVLPPAVRLSPDGQVVRDPVLANGGRRLVYHDVGGSRIRSAQLATGFRKTIGTNEGDSVDIDAADVGPLVAYARDDGFSKIRRVSAVGGTIEESTETSRNFAVGYQGATLYYVSGGDTWYWSTDGSETQLTAGQVGSGAGAPDRDLFVYADFSGVVRVVTEFSEQSAGALTPPGATVVNFLEYTWLGDRVLLDVTWTNGDETVWLVDTASLTSREIGAGKVVYATDSSVLFEGPSGEGYVGFLDEVKAPKRLGTIEGVWAASDDFIVGSDELTKTRVFSWAGAGQEFLDIEDGLRVVKLMVAGNRVLSVQFNQSQSSLFVQGKGGGEMARVSPLKHWVYAATVGPDGWLYWVARTQAAPFEFALYRARPGGGDVMQLTPWSTDGFGPVGGVEPDSWMFAQGGDYLIGKQDDSYWALDLSGVAPYACGGLPATIVGTSGDDVLVGTPGLDVIVSRGGNDEVRAGKGPDRICLGAGNDSALGHRGFDRIWGSGGDDDLQGNQGNDRLIDKSGANVADGGLGTDYCVVTGTVTRCEKP